MRILKMVAIFSIWATVIMGIVFDIPWQVMLSLGISYMAIGIYGKLKSIELGGNG